MTSTLRRSNSGDLADAIGSTLGPAIFNRYVISLAPTEITQAGNESARPRTPYGRIGAEHPDKPLISWLLRFCGQRPCTNEATNDFYEFPPLHGFPAL